MKINSWLDITSGIQRHHSEGMNESSLADVDYLPTEGDKRSFSLNLINEQQFCEPVWARSNEQSLIL